jgi:hypothetical protein
MAWVDPVVARYITPSAILDPSCRKTESRECHFFDFLKTKVMLICAVLLLPKAGAFYERPTAPVRERIIFITVDPCEQEAVCQFKD